MASDQDRLRQLGNPDEIKNELVKQFTKQIEEEVLDNDDNVSKVKLVVVGPTGAGKSSWVTQLIQNKFSEHIQPTIGAKFSSQGVAIGEDDDEEVYNFEIWDVSGEEWCKSLLPMYLQFAQACVVCYDASSTASFQEAQEWIKFVQGIKKEGTLIMCLVGMKHDLSNIAPLPIQSKQAESFFEEENLNKDFLFPNVSAKSGEGVQDVILTLAEAFHEQGIKAPRASVMDLNDAYALGNTNKNMNKTLSRLNADPYAQDGPMDKFKDKAASCWAVLRVYTSSCFDSSKEKTKAAAEVTNKRGKEFAGSVKRQSLRFGGKMSEMSSSLKHKAKLIRSKSSGEEFVADSNNTFENGAKPSDKNTLVQVPN
eukprot:maker-scaffold_26-snap-gene-1.4-mRNA-1 protein AED:0.02 eAED:0.02 QI:400/1/1/1/1/1/3/231/366